MRCAALWWGGLFATSALAQAAVPTYQVEVVGVALLPGLGVPLRELPQAVQTLAGPQLDGRRASNLAATLDQQLGSVNLNDTTGNPFQFDLQLRGFTASPALGTPQGLSVFLDGVRINESFGDTVNWDLIPDLALAQVTVLPGTDPVYGLNTLGGAVALTTQRGFDDPATLARLQAGAFGRAALELQAGGHEGSTDHYIALRRWHDKGWAQQSGSEVRQLFTQWGWRDGPWDVSANLAAANNRLLGSQTLPLSWGDTPRQAYTYPDGQENRMLMLALRASLRLEGGGLLEGSLYWRQVRSASVNSNVNDDFDPTQPVGEDNPATRNARSNTSQVRPGGTLQWSRPWTLGDWHHRLVLGTTLETGRTRFLQSDQAAGSSRDTRSDQPIVTTTLLRARQWEWGVFAVDRLQLDEATTLSLALRHDQATIHLRDQLGTALNGDHRFQRWSPALGLAWSPAHGGTAYASLSQGLRVPTPVELTCADPQAPCALPNAFVADPPLKAVRSQTMELGWRGRDARGLGASIGLFRTDLQDDLQFISAGGSSANAGYFQNVGRTRRQGLELALDRHQGPWGWSARYSLLSATFQTPLVLNSPNHSTAAPITCADCTEIAVRPGDRLPGLPRQLLKLRLQVDPADRWTLGLGAQAQSKVYARGDESNHDSHGPLPGFALFSLDAEWRPAPGWALALRVDNLFDRRTSSFATLGQNVFTGPGRSFDPSGATWRSEPFLAQGAPRTIGLSLSWWPG